MDELRDSLNVIRNFAHILQEHHAVLDSSEVAEAATAIEEQSELALQTLDETLGGAPEEPALYELTRAYGLSPREIEVLSHVATGLADKQIAGMLSVSTVTVSKHVGAILQKMGAASRTEAGVRALREGLI
jgi:DNA-binding NarL/FixJ family response regulator